ncbi:ArsR/SmtB family transcription factor [Kitasatospora aureofaciens]|uniref:ArsR/SmtB family transcription factor n=1 Tax=Kitasatospora aureofaciens TaxID=1894 RepID=UPI0036F4985A
MTPPPSRRLLRRWLTGISCSAPPSGARLLAEPGRLAVLVALRAAGAIAVSDLALACGMNPPAVSQALRLLRVSGVVKSTRSGRIVRYALCDGDLVRLLDDAVPARG